jgi:hypothetical protein
MYIASVGSFVISPAEISKEIEGQSRPPNPSLVSPGFQLALFFHEA